MVKIVAYFWAMALVGCMLLPFSATQGETQVLWKAHAGEKDTCTV